MELKIRFETAPKTKLLGTFIVFMNTIFIGSLVVMKTWNWYLTEFLNIYFIDYQRALALFLLIKVARTILGGFNVNIKRIQDNEILVTMFLLPYLSLLISWVGSLVL